MKTCSDGIYMMIAYLHENQKTAFIFRHRSEDAFYRKVFEIVALLQCEIREWQSRNSFIFSPVDILQFPHCLIFWASAVFPVAFAHVAPLPSSCCLFAFNVNLLFSFVKVQCLSHGEQNRERVSEDDGGQKWRCACGLSGSSRRMFCGTSEPSFHSYVALSFSRLPSGILILLLIGSWGTR